MTSILKYYVKSKVSFNVDYIKKNLILIGD